MQGTHLSFCEKQLTLLAPPILVFDFFTGKLRMEIRVMETGQMKF